MGGRSSKKAKQSAEQARLQKEQTELAKQQQVQLEQQKAQLAQQEAESSAQAEADRQRRIKGQKAARLKLRGRRSLIASGSELGTEGQLG